MRGVQPRTIDAFHIAYDTQKSDLGSKTTRAAAPLWSFKRSGRLKSWIDIVAQPATKTSNFLKWS
jgi:hypothetical protein